ncbi:hypothetical protein J1614_009990 [Plenodomus biglobosus]|nr:hypothetical protein J1614_009990 [Plenodomus biglobosus]
MAIFPSKSEFLGVGTQPITPSIVHASHDCFICKNPLAVHPHTTTSAAASHPALRITSCGHILGVECLSAWLDTSNTCPTCSRTLFEVSAHHITQEDVNAVIRSLGHMYSESRIMSVLAQRMDRKYLEEALTRQKNEESRRKEVEEEGARSNQYTMSEQDWLDSDEELDVGDDDDDDDSDFDADEDFEADGDDEDKGIVE